MAVSKNKSKSKVVIRKTVKAKYKKPPQKPSQRNITVKDLRDIKRHHLDLKEAVEDLVTMVQSQADESNRLHYRVEGLEGRVKVLEGRFASTDAPALPSTEPVDGQVLGDEQ